MGLPTIDYDRLYENILEAVVIALDCATKPLPPTASYEDHVKKARGDKAKEAFRHDPQANAAARIIVSRVMMATRLEIEDYCGRLLLHIKES